MDISSEALDFVNNHIDELVKSGELNHEIERVIRLRYGVDSGEPMNFSELRKTFRWSVAKMRRELIRAEKLVFNVIKRDI